jgi:hypothetical protein
MQKLLLELGGPLVIAAVLLGLAKMIRGVIERFRAMPQDHGQEPQAEEKQQEEQPEEPKG